MTKLHDHQIQASRFFTTEHTEFTENYLLNHV